MTDLLSKEAVADIYTAVVHAEAQQDDDARLSAGFEVELLLEQHGGYHGVMRRLIDMMRTNERELVRRREAAEKPAHNWQDEFAGACRTLAAITELLDIPADDVNGEPSQIFDAIESLKTRLAAYDRAAKEPVVLPDYMPRISDATLDNIIKQDEEGSVANAARILAAEVKFWHSKPLFTAPPLPVVPDDLLSAVEEVIRISDREHEAWDRAKYAISSYRAAMLKHVSLIDEGNNYPVIPEGWALVPVEPTPEMIAAAMESDDVSFDTKDETLFYVHHDNIYAAMIAAAPQPGKGAS